MCGEGEGPLRVASREGPATPTPGRTANKARAPHPFGGLVQVRARGDNGLHALQLAIPTCDVQWRHTVLGNTHWGVGEGGRVGRLWLWLRLDLGLGLRCGERSS